MPEDIENLMHVLHFFLWVAAVCATIFPIAYAIVPWFRSALGRALMLQSVSLALALDVTLFFQYWNPYPEHILIAFWVNVVVFGMIAVATSYLTFLLLRLHLTRTRSPK